MQGLLTDSPQSNLGVALPIALCPGHLLMSFLSASAVAWAPLTLPKTLPKIRLPYLAPQFSGHVCFCHEKIRVESRIQTVSRWGAGRKSGEGQGLSILLSSPSPGAPGVPAQRP